MHWAITLSLILSALAFAKAPKFDEQKVYEALKPHVATLEQPLETYHWEKADSDYAKRFNADDPKGLYEMTRSSARSYLDDDGAHGLYLALDPATSRQYGGQNWRLVQVKMPAGLRYLDIRHEDHSSEENAEYKTLRDKLDAALPGDEGASCVGALLLAVNNGAVQDLDSMFGDGKCAQLKRRVFRRLKISAVRYQWQTSRMKYVCPGRDSSAFVVTDSGWIRPESVRGFTKASTGFDEDRAAIQEVLRHTRFLGAKARPFESDLLWKDVPDARGKELSRKTKIWLKDNVENCKDLKLTPVPATYFFGVQGEEGTPKPADEKAEDTNAPAN